MTHISTLRTLIKRKIRKFIFRTGLWTSVFWFVLGVFFAYMWGLPMKREVRELQKREKMIMEKQQEIAIQTALRIISDQIAIQFAVHAMNKADSLEQKLNQ